MLSLIDNTLGKWLRHFLFIVVRGYFTLFYNVSCAGKHLLQDAPGTLILATHVSRYDGPLIASILYTTVRIRPTVHYDEYYHPLQWFPMWVSAAIPMSSPKSWPDAKRQARKADTLRVILDVMRAGAPVLLFPAGKTRRQPEEIVAPYLSGVHDILRAAPETPVVLLRIEGLGKFQAAKHDYFWSFLGRSKGRRHVSVDIRPLTDLDPAQDLETFNAVLERRLNQPISTDL